MAEATVRKGREGSRWYNQRPTAEEVAEWFISVPLHDGMEHWEYVGGVTLIPAKEKSDEVVGFDKQGLPQVRERHDLVWIPYVKIETRVAYFWKFMEKHPDWVGSFEKVDVPNTDTLGLPPGFFSYRATDPKGKEVKFVGCSYQVSIYERSRTTGQLAPVMTAPAGTKIVSTATKWDVDQNALMKAETGAIGRALGFAGMLIVPGSGVATAEDMQDAAVPPGPSPEPEPELPAVEQKVPEQLNDEQLRERATELVSTLADVAPEKHKAFQEWARGRKLTLADAQGAPLRGAVKKLEKTIDELEASVA